MLFRCILLVLAAASLAEGIKFCSAPLPIFREGRGELLQVLAYVRHGHRSPHLRVDGLNQCRYTTGKHQYSLEKKWTKACDSEELTKKGANQSRRIGERFKEVYVDNHGLLPSTYKSSKIQIFWDKSKRTQDTAKYIIKGMYGDMQDETIEGAMEPSLHFTDELKACPALEAMMRERVKAVIKEQGSSYFKPIVDLLSHPDQPHRLDALTKCPYKTFPDVAVNVVEAMYCNPVKPAILSRNVEKKYLKEALEKGKFTVYRTFNSRKLDRYFLTENNKKVQAQLLKASQGKNKHKLFLSSTHDTTITAWLKILGVKSQTGSWIGYGSTLVFELWKCHMGKFWVRALFNGKVVRIIDNQEWAPLASFMEKLEELEAPEWGKTCANGEPMKRLSLSKVLKQECKAECGKGRGNSGDEDISLTDSEQEELHDEF